MSEPEACEITSNPNSPLVFQHVYETSTKARAKASIQQLLKAAETSYDNDGYSQELRRMLPNIIFGQYELFVRLAPWKRHPATVVLRQICMIFTVRGFHPRHFP